MRWIVGSRRTRTYFLWLPVTIGGETRWLERATVVEQFQNTMRGAMWRVVEFKD